MLRRGLFFAAEDSDGGSIDTATDSGADTTASDGFTPEITQADVDEAFGIAEPTAALDKNAQQDTRKSLTEQQDIPTPSTSSPGVDFESRMAQLREELSNDFNSRLLQLVQQQNQPQPEEPRGNPLENLIMQKIQEREDNRRNEQLTQEYRTRLTQIAEANPNDFQDGSLMKRMESIANGEMTPDDLYFAANRKAIIQREREAAATAAIQMFKKEASRRKDLLLAGAQSAEVKADTQKNDSQLNFDDVAEEEYAKHILGQ